MNEKDFLISVCVPVYCVEQFIERCARSLFGQSYDNLEFVFVDDCSKDKSIDVIYRVIIDYPHRKDSVKVVKHQVNRGVAAARNSAVDNANGEFIYWADADDYIEKDTIEKLVNKQKLTGADILTSNYREDWGGYKKTVEIKHSDNQEEWLNMILSRETQIMTWGRMVRTSLYKDYKIRAIEGCNMGEDFQLIPRLFYYSKKLAFVDEYLYNYYRANELAYSFSFSEEKVNQILKGLDFIKEFFNDKDENLKMSLNIGEARMLAMYTVSSVRDNNKDFYHTLRNRMNTIPYSTIRQLRLSERMVFLLKPYSILRLYCNLGHLFLSFGK